MFFVFLTLKDFYFSNIRNYKNTFQNYYQMHSYSPFDNDFRKYFKKKHLISDSLKKKKKKTFI